jgi:hypothetical protein
MLTCGAGGVAWQGYTRAYRRLDPATAEAGWVAGFLASSARRVEAVPFPQSGDLARRRHACPAKRGVYPGGSAPCLTTVGDADDRITRPTWG